jgi:hypothetical protein
MINLLDFYHDKEFIAALYYNGSLTNEDIYNIAHRLLETENNDILIDIVVSKYKDENLYKFERYINDIKVDSKNKKIFLTKKIFQYILNNLICSDLGIRFIHFELIDREQTKEYLGDDIGVEQILGKYWAIDDRDVTDPKEIKKLEEEIKQEMQNYIDNN